MDRLRRRLRRSNEGKTHTRCACAHCKPVRGGAGPTKLGDLVSPAALVTVTKANALDMQLYEWVRSRSRSALTAHAAVATLTMRLKFSSIWTAPSPPRLRDAEIDFVVLASRSLVMLRYGPSVGR